MSESVNFSLILRHFVLLDFFGFHKTSISSQSSLTCV